MDFDDISRLSIISSILKEESILNVTSPVAVVSTPSLLLRLLWLKVCKNNKSISLHLLDRITLISVSLFWIGRRTSSISSAVFIKEPATGVNIFCKASISSILAKTLSMISFCFIIRVPETTPPATGTETCSAIIPRAILTMVCTIGIIFANSVKILLKLFKRVRIILVAFNIF